MLLARKADLLKPGTADSPRAPDLRQTRPSAGARAGERGGRRRGEGRKGEGGKRDGRMGGRGGEGRRE